MSGPECCSNPPTLAPGSGVGHVEKVGGLDSYVSGSPDSTSAILLVSDAFGYEAPNLRNLADKIAAAGFQAVVPDFLHGDPFNPENPERPIEVWIKDHGADKGFGEAKPIIEELESRGVMAIGSAGFCWGAKVVVDLAKYDFTKAVVLCHPSYVTVDDIKGVKVPIAILGAELDPVSPPALLTEFKEVLNAKPEVVGYVKILPKVAHGWTITYDVNDESAVKAAEKAHEDLLEWFVKYVKREHPETINAFYRTCYDSLWRFLY